MAGSYDKNLLLTRDYKVSISSCLSGRSKCCYGETGNSSIGRRSLEIGDSILEIDIFSGYVVYKTLISAN